MCLLLLLAVLVCGISACKDRAGKNVSGNRITTLLGERSFQPKDSMLAERVIDSVYRSLPGRTPGDERERFYLLANYAQTNTGNSTRALRYSDSLLPLAENAGLESEEYLEAILQRGDIFTGLRRYDEAFTLFFRAKQLVLKKNNPCLLPTYTARLASVCFRLRRFKEAADFYKVIVTEYHNCQDSSFWRFAAIQANYDNIGIMYSRINWLDSAETYYRKALVFIDSNENRFPGRRAFMEIAKAVVYGNQGDVAARLGRTEEAKALFRKSIAYNSRPGYILEDAGYTMVKLAGLYLAEGKTDSVAPMMAKIDEIRKAFPRSELKGRYLDLRTQYAAARKDSGQAYRYLLEYNRYNDSILMPAISNPLISVGNALEQVGRQYQLENDNRRKNDYLVLGAFGLAMLLVIIGLLWFYYLRSRRSIGTLNELNKNISDKNAALLETLEKLEQMRRDKRQLMHIVAHDLRSPVGSITTLAKMLRQDQVEPEMRHEVLDMIIKAGTSSQSLINELLEGRARETAGKQETVDIAEVLQDAVGVLRYRAAEKQQSLTLHSLPVQLISDREKLQRIFHNLLDNAIKFSPHGAEIKIEMEEQDDRLRICIIDHGIGIPEDKRNALLDEASSFKRMGTYGEPSYGLGLSIVSQLVRETGGHITYTSAENEGTTFCLEYPLTGE
ncbi:sensor histidine kinase [Sediminibacterium soli]|uniref:sensor histidine kinase n=1 Tax=Sediminibacterium soli TaxID=2698829 RepID=UPI001379B18B|nr:HAMP domain-containing sensor histidine kinase [Sediminibacterium soli]NCI46910.1 GHKL domain-containing protein [Sediminibacterium soli]